MNKFSAIAGMILLLLLGYSMISTIKYRSDAYVTLQKKRAEYVINYATDSAVASLTEDSSDLGLDYEAYESVSVNPQVALETFLEVVCHNYDLPVNDSGFNVIKNRSLSMFAVVTYDGFYVAKQSLINGQGGHDLIFSMKQPYSYIDANGDYYALNLGHKDAKLFKDSSIMKVDAPISEADQKAVINRRVTEALAEAVTEGSEDKAKGSFYLPTEITAINTTNPIDGITVLAYMDAIDVGRGYNSNVFSIGGSRIDRAVYYAGYTSNGWKCYRRADKLTDDITVQAIFNNSVEAAEAGYYFDLNSIGY